VLETPRLLLRPFRHDEAEAVFGYARRPGFFRHLDHVPERVRQAYTLADAEGHLRELLALARRGWPHWAVLWQGRVVGAVRLTLGPDGPELGYGIDPEASGRGLATEAAGAVVAWALPHADPLWARTHPANLASQRVLARLGFEAAGVDPRGRRRFLLRAARTEGALGSVGGTGRLQPPAGAKS
jgi:RimJ/RimL family protein N-acetyltransferase